jgi:hypothetical protein
MAILLRDSRISPSIREQEAGLPAASESRRRADAASRSVIEAFILESSFKTENFCRLWKLDGDAVLARQRREIRESCF